MVKMEFEEELNQLKAIQKQTLQKYIALASQYNRHWTEYLDVSQKIQLICARQNLRAQEGFSPTDHPRFRPEFHQMNQNAQFEERQRFKEQMFAHQNDEQTVKALSQQLKQSRDFAKTNLKYMGEVFKVFEHLSEVVNGFRQRRRITNKRLKF
jgi:mannose-6-phosphate isomerase class I